MIYETIKGDEVPALGLGTWKLQDDAGVKTVATAIDIGYRHIDTAQAYENEAEVGRGIAQSGCDREDLFVTTKVGRDLLAPDDVRSSTEESLRQLDMDYVDLLLIHWPNEEDADLEVTLDAFRAVQEDGLTRHIGVSNFPSALLERALDYARLFCNQVEYHPFLSQEKLVATCREYDLLLTAYSPLAQGQAIDEAKLREIGERHGKTPAQVTLRWLVQQPHVAAIPKASSRDHLEANFDIWDFELSKDEMQAIHGLARGQRLIDPDWGPDWD